MPLQILADKTRQALGVATGSSYQPISLDRYQHALQDADRFAAWLAAYRGNVDQLKNALQGFFQATSAAVSDCPLPSLYSERYDTRQLRALPHPPPPKGYAHLFTLPDQTRSSSSPAAAAPGADGSSSSSQDPAAAALLLQQLPSTFPDKFDGQVLVPIELWLQAYKEAQARLVALDKLRERVDAQCLKLHKQGQLFVKRHQERKHRSATSSARSSFERAPPAALPAVATDGGSSTAKQPAAAAASAAAPTSLAAAAAALLAGKADADSVTEFSGTNFSGSFARGAGADAGALHTLPSSPLVSFSGFAAAAAATPEQQQHQQGAAAAGQGSMEGYVEGLVRLRSFPLADAPTSVASSGDSRRNSGEQQQQQQAAGPHAESGSGAASSEASPPRRGAVGVAEGPSVHAALSVPSSVPAAAPAAAPAPTELAGAAGGASGAVAEAEQDKEAASTSTDRQGSAGLDEEESWAAAVLHRRGDQGLLQAHEMVERALGPLLSEFSKAEMQLSTLLGWLVTQAVRLRAYLNHLLLSSATAVEGWTLPPGLLEPFPADVLLTGEFAGHHYQQQHHHKAPSRHTPGAAAASSAPAAPISPEPSPTRQLLPHQQQQGASAAPAALTAGSASHAPVQRGAGDLLGGEVSSGAAVAAPGRDGAFATAAQPQATGRSTGQRGRRSFDGPRPAAAPGTAAAWASADHTRSETPAAASILPATPAAAAGSSAAAEAASDVLEHHQAVGTAEAADPADHSAAQHIAGTALPPSSTPLPQPSSTSNLSVGSAVLAAMVRSLSWKSSGNVSGPGGRASRASSGTVSATGGPGWGQVSRASSGSTSSKSAPRPVLTGLSAGEVDRWPAAAGGPLGEGVLAVSPRGDATPPEAEGFGPDAGITAAALPTPAAAGVLHNSHTGADSRTHAAAAGAAAAAGGAGVSTADMTYLAQDRALIESLSEQALSGASFTGSSSSSGLPSAATAAGAASQVGATAEDVSSTSRAGLAPATQASATTTSTDAVPRLEAAAGPAATAASAGATASRTAGVVPDAHLSPSDRLHRGTDRLQGSTAKAASERGLRRQQLLARAAELDAEAEAHAAAAVEAARLAEVCAGEGAEFEVLLRREVTVERSRLLERQEVVVSELSQLEGEVPRLRAAAAEVQGELREVERKLQGLAAQEAEAVIYHRSLISRRSSVSLALRELDAHSSREALQARVTQAQTELAGKQEAVRSLEAEVSKLRAELRAAETAKAEAQHALTGIAAAAATGGSELADADARLLGHRSDLARLSEVELPRLEQHLREVQARLVNLKQSGRRLEAQAQLTELQKRLQLDREEVAEWETTCSSMSSRLSELTVVAQGLSCEAASYGAKAVAARGLQRAEETRAAAAGAEAAALKAAAEAMVNSQGAMLSASTAATGATAVASATTHTSSQQHSTTATALTDTTAAVRPSDSTSSGLGPSAGTAATAADRLGAETSPAAAGSTAAGASKAAESATAAETAGGGQGADTAAAESGVVLNRLAAAGPLQEVAGPVAVAVTPAAAGAADASTGQGLLHSRPVHQQQQQQQDGVVDGATQAPVAEVHEVHSADAGDRHTGAVDSLPATATATATATAAPDTPAGPLAATGEAGSAVPTREDTAGEAAAAPGAGGIGGSVPALGADGRSNPLQNLVPGSRATVVADTVPGVASSAGVSSTAAPAAAIGLPPSADITVPTVTISGAGVQAAGAGEATAATADERRAEVTGPVPTALPAAAAASPAVRTSRRVSGEGAQHLAAAVPAAPGSVASVASSSRSSQRRRTKDSGWLSHFKPHKANPEDHFYLPLAGLDVDITTMRDQQASAQPWPAQTAGPPAPAAGASAAPAQPQHHGAAAGGVGGYAAAAVADGAFRLGPLGCRELHGQQQEAAGHAVGMPAQSAQLPAGAAVPAGDSGRAGPLGGREGARRRAAPAAAAAAATAAGPAETQRAAFAAAPAGADVMDVQQWGMRQVDAGRYRATDGDLGSHGAWAGAVEQGSSMQVVPAAGVQYSAGGETSAGYVPGPLEHGGGRWRKGGNRAATNRLH